MGSIPLFKQIRTDWQTTDARGLPNNRKNQSFNLLKILQNKNTKMSCQGSEARISRLERMAWNLDKKFSN
jgi:hypothetical protein